MREISNNRIISAEMVDGNGKVKCMVHPSSSQYGGIRSAINHVYILEIVQMKEIMKREISTFFAGMERTIITEKQMIGLENSEEENSSSSRHMSSLRRNYLKA